MTFYKQKGWYKSRTIWTGIVSTIIGALVLFGIPIPVEATNTVVGAIMVVVGTLTMLFRSRAEAEITL